jgi:hypothetical protein
LPHPATQGFPHPPRLLNELPRSTEERAHRATQALGKAKHHGIETPNEFGNRDPSGYRSVEDPGTVEVYGDSVGVGDFQDFPSDGKGPDPAARGVVGVLQAHKPRLGEVIEFGPDGVAHLFCRKDPALAENDPGLDPGETGHRGHLHVVDVGSGFHDDLLAGPGVDSDGHLVSHGAGRNEKGRLGTRDLRGFFLEPIYRGIFSVDIIAHLRLGHDLAHGRRGLRHRIRTEVNHRNPSSPIRGTNVTGQRCS